MVLDGMNGALNISGKPVITFPGFVRGLRRVGSYYIALWA